MLFYSIELLLVHITCLHVYYCLHIPSSLAQDARLCHGRGKDRRILWRYPNSRRSLGFHGFGDVHAKRAWRLPSPQTLHCCEGRLVSGAVPPPTARPLGRAAGVPQPVCSGCGRCGCGDPAPAPRLAPLRAGVARRGGGGRASPGGSPSAVVRGVWGQAIPLHRLPAPWAGCGGPLPTCYGCGGVRAWGPVTNPTVRALASWLCALWGRHEGPRGGRLLPGCGASGVGRSPSPDCPPSGRAAGAHYPLAVSAGGCGRGDPSPTPQRALLRAVGAA